MVLRFSVSFGLRLAFLTTTTTTKNASFAFFVVSLTHRVQCASYASVSFVTAEEQNEEIPVKRERETTLKKKKKTSRQVHVRFVDIGSLNSFTCVGILISPVWRER